MHFAETEYDKSCHFDFYHGFKIKNWQYYLIGLQSLFKVKSLVAMLTLELK